MIDCTSYDVQRYLLDLDQITFRQLKILLNKHVKKCLRNDEDIAKELKELYSLLLSVSGEKSELLKVLNERNAKKESDNDNKG